MNLTHGYCTVFAALLLSCALVSCQKRENPSSGEAVVKFDASFDNTKIERDEEGKSFWEVGNAIDIFYPGTYDACNTWAFTEQSGPTTTFTTEEPIPTDKNLYVAVYPSSWQSHSFDADLDLEERKLKITLHELSSACTFSNCAICSASTTKAGGKLVFKNICSMLKYSSSNKDITEASLYVDEESTRYIFLTPSSTSENTTYYATLSCGYNGGGYTHINNLGLRLTSRSAGVDYPVYSGNVNKDFYDSRIYNLGNIEEKTLSDESKAGEVSSLRLMSFNILRGDLNTNHLWDGGTNPRKEACLAMLSADNPDILNLQECTPRQRRQILDQFPRYGAVGLCVNGELGGNYFRSMLSVNNVSSNSIIYNSDKLLVEDYGNYWFSDTPSKAGSYTWNAQKPRNLVWARFRIKGSNRRFICISMHLQNNGDLFYSDGTKITDATDLATYGEENRIKSVNLFLNKLLPKINPGNLPVILSGDCNAGLTTPALNNLQTKFAAAASLTPSGSRDTGYTFNGFVEGGKSRIDHIFSTRCTHLNYCVDRNSYSGVSFISDHWPVYTDFAIPEDLNFDSSLEGWTTENIN